MLFSIQFYRAVAALAVVIFHLNKDILPYGWVGVDLFFVISGVIMGTVGTKELPLEFLFKRIIRIVPIYWAATIAIALLAVTANVFATYKFHLSDLTQSLLFIPYRADHGLIQPIIRPGWTLNFEMFFYCLFALGLIVRAPVVWCFFAITTLCVVGALFSPQAAPLQLWTAPLMFEFLLGLLISQVRVRGGAKVALPLIAVGAILLVVGFTVGKHDNAFGVDRVIAFGVPFALIVLGSVALEQHGLWPRVRMVEHIGDISYSLYLLHTTVLAAATRFLGDGYRGQIVGLLVAIAVAEVSFRLVERPSRKYLQNIMLPRKQINVAI